MVNEVKKRLTKYSTKGASYLDPNIDFELIFEFFCYNINI